MGQGSVATRIDIARPSPTTAQRVQAAAQPIASTTGDDPLVDGMHISLRMRLDFVVTDAGRFLTAARRVEACAPELRERVQCRSTPRPFKNGPAHGSACARTPIWSADP
jgi:hypothetical protein